MNMDNVLWQKKKNSKKWKCCSPKTIGPPKASRTAFKILTTSVEAFLNSTTPDSADIEEYFCKLVAVGKLSNHSLVSIIILLHTLLY